ncbi:MAG: dockerin type I repeat-containing protein, partial [Ruminococcus sp.]|nr:dockerin type I repeat-containing protein [Ruminococcus sp.]
FKYNFSFDTGNGEAVFYVGDSGSLTLTNVHSLSPGSDDIGTFTYAFPIVKSSGNLRIDSGIYYSYNETPAVEIDGGTAVINGGYFKSTYYKSSAVKITAPDKEKTTVEINYGNFGALNTAVYMDRDTVVTINGGNFEYKDTDRNLYQKYALYAYDADLTINGGYFYGSLNALDARGLHSLNISNGYFKLYNQTEDGNLAAVYLGGDYSTNTIISGGRYYGNKGIEFSSKTDFSKIIPQGCYVTDNDTGLVIDHNITDYSLGGSIDIFAKRPRITTQPSGGHSLNMGDAIVLKIDADNANEYIWHIIDENGKELSWNYLSNNGYTTPNVYSGGKMLMLREVSDWMTGKRVYCEVKGYGGTVMSDIVTLSVDKVVKYCRDMYFDNFDQIWNHKTVGDFKNPKTDTDAPYTIGNVRWAMFRKILGDDYEFDSGDNVTVAIDVIPKEGYTFYSTVYGKLNGIDSNVTVKNQDGSRSIVFDMTITVPDEYKTQDIELSVTEPVAGVKPSTTATCTSGYAIPGTPSWTPADTTFKSGTQYTVKIPVTAEYEWGDTSTVTAKVNGKEAKFIAENKGGKQYAYYVEYTFDATKDYLLGDVNGDGNISVLDATLIQKYIAGLVTFSDTQKAAADVNNDGSVSIVDATLIQKYIAGLIDKF